MNEPTSVPHVEQVAPAGASQSAAAPNGPSALAIDILRRTRPWTMFLAILGFIGAGFMVIATIFDSVYAFAAGGAGSWLSRTRIRAIETVSGLCLIGGGVWLALRGR